MLTLCTKGTYDSCLHGLTHHAISCPVPISPDRSWWHVMIYWLVLCWPKSL